MSRIANIILFALTACVTVQTEKEPTTLNAHTDDHLVTPNTRVDPTSPIRISGPGTETWVAPELLEANVHALFVRVPLAGAIKNIVITPLSRPRLEALEALQGDGATLSEAGLELRVAGDDLRAWLQSALAISVKEAADEVWTFTLLRDQNHRQLTVFQVSVGYLRVHGGLAKEWLEGGRWNELRSFEVAHFDGGSVAASLVSFGIAAIITSSDRDPNLDTPLQLPMFSSAQSDPVPENAGAIPLFTATARRRARVRPFFDLGGGADLSGSTQLTGMVGVRLFNLLELGVGARAWWPQPFSESTTLASSPLGDSVSRSVPFLFPTVRAGLVFDLDADRRFLVTLRTEGGLGAGGLVQVRLAWGFQLRLFEGLFIELDPFTLQYTSLSFGGANRRQNPTTLEIGSTF